MSLVPVSRSYLRNLYSDLEVEVFDWPDTFHVEARELDREYLSVFPDVEPEVYPYLVDLSSEPEGECDCRDFRFNVRPYIDKPNHRKTCIHIIAARRFKNLLGTKPKKLPDIIK